VQNNSTLKFLVKLQLSDSEMDDILGEQRGLPEEINALKRQLADLSARLEIRKRRLTESEVKKRTFEKDILSAQEKIKKYKEQQTSARNNKEYDAMSKQIEYEEQEIKKTESQIRVLRDFEIQIAQLEAQGKALLAENRDDEVTGEMLPTDYIEKKIGDLQTDITEKESELGSIVQDSQAQVDELKMKIVAERKQVEEADRVLLGKYEHLRQSNTPNAVVKFSRNACNGCHTKIPASKHSPIYQGFHYICESCGRIVVHESYFEEATATA
jgi:uncharacterized protein